MGSYSHTEQKDQRVIAEEARILAAPESILAMPGSIAAEKMGNYSPVITQEFTPEIAAAFASLVESGGQTASQLLGLTDRALAGLFAANESLQEQTGETQLGEASVFTKWLPYVILGVIAFVILGKR